jgi:hypothetical protein
MCRKIQKDRKTKIDTDFKILQVIDIIQKLQSNELYTLTTNSLFIYIYVVKDVYTYSVQACVST